MPIEVLDDGRQVFLEPVKSIPYRPARFLELVTHSATLPFSPISEHTFALVDPSPSLRRRSDSTDATTCICLQPDGCSYNPLVARRRLNVDLSEESYDGWDTFAGTHRLTVSAMAEAVGLMLGAEPGLPEDVMSEMIGIAAQVAAERRSRRR